jgi:hypothetical protein
MPTPDPALSQLDGFVGAWSMEGPARRSEGGTIHGRTTYEPLPTPGSSTATKLRISMSYDPLDAMFHGRFSEDGDSFSGAWAPNPGAAPEANLPSTIGGSRIA